MTDEEREELRQNRIANLKPFTSEYQPPGHKKSRKGIPNRVTFLKWYMKEFEKREARNEKARKAKRAAQARKRRRKRRVKKVAAE